MGELDALSHGIIGAAIEVHRTLGPGLLESAYEACLAYELENRGYALERQRPLAVKYGELHIDCGYRLDMLVNDAVVVELKSVQSLEPIHEAQLLTYLKLSERKLGLLINFNVKVLRQGVKRIVLNY